MDIVEFNRHLGYATPKEMVDNFSKTLAMYCVLYDCEADVTTTKKSNRIVYVVTPSDKSNVDFLIDSIGSKNTIVHENFFKFRTNRYNEDSLSVEIYKGQY